MDVCLGGPVHNELEGQKAKQSDSETRCAVTAGVINYRRPVGGRVCTMSTFDPAEYANVLVQSRELQ